MHNTFSLNHTLEHVAHLLPAQGPLKDFIHHNTLHSFQNEPFDTAVLKAAELYNAQAYMPLSFYREEYNKQKINEHILNKYCSELSITKNELELEFFRLALHQFIDTKDIYAWSTLLKQFNIDNTEAKRISSSIVLASELDTQNKKVHIRTVIQSKCNLSFDEQINPILFRLTAGYLDQGISLWHFPHTELSFFENIGKLAHESFINTVPFTNKESLKKWFALGAHETVLSILNKMVGNEELYEQYITETLMAHAGWSGMVNEIAKKPSSLLVPRDITLLDFLAIKLILEWELIQAQCNDYKQLADEDFNKKVDTNDQIEIHSNSLAFLILKSDKKFRSLDPSFLSSVTQRILMHVWHQAFEETYYQSILSGLKAHQINRTSQTLSSETSKPNVQALFCIDDRECSIRRYLEEVDEGIETFGTPGFFGLDFYFQSLNDSIPVKLCPAPVSPRHLVKEVPLPTHLEEFEKQRNEKRKTAIALHRWRETAGSLIFGFLAANTLGHLSLIRLFACLFKPKKLFQAMRTKTITVPSQLSFWKKDTPLEGSALQHGYTYEEMAQRIESVLRSIGLINNFSPVVMIVAHGSSSANNPHFAAYDCGACSGRPGAPNARTFATMANNPNVRSILKQRGIDVPESTKMIGGLHDTCTDIFEFFDVETLYPTQTKAYKEFLNALDKARHLNAQERCRRFESVELNINAQAAINEVAHRASSLFEPRPELNHATNSICIVGRRSLTKGLFLDRRAFLNSYDPTTDPQGIYLNQILSAAIPVCGGINLEYYFSRIDSGVYGCGTKLSHNVCSLLGVYNGIDDDLRTGLPVQMTEVHDPIKLLIIVEQTTQMILMIMSKNSGISEWIENGWVRLACIDPQTQEFYTYIPKKGFQKYDTPQRNNKNIYSYISWAQSSRDNLEVAALVTHG